MSDSPSSSPSPIYSIASVLSVVCAIGSFMSGAILGLILAVVAILLGSFGALLSLSPHRRGGFLSTLAMIAGVIGIIAAVFKAIFFFF